MDTGKIDSRLAKRVLSGDVWDELRTFLAVSRCKSFNKAARRLASSQPTVSRAVRRLEDQTGQKLVRRSGNGVELTPEGQALADLASGIDASIYTTISNLADSKTKPVGHVRVAVSEGLAGCFAATSLGMIADEFPRIDVSLLLPRDRRSVDENTSDIVVGFARDHSDKVQSRPLGFLHLIPVAAVRYVEKHGADPSPSHVFVQSTYYEHGSDVWDPWRACCATGHVRFHADSMFTYGALVRSGRGIGLMASYLTAQNYVVPVNLDCHIKLPLFLSVSRSRASDPSVEVICDWLIDIFGPHTTNFGPEVVINPDPSNSDEGLRYLFNLV